MKMIFKDSWDKSGGKLQNILPDFEGETKTKICPFRRDMISEVIERKLRQRKTNVLAFFQTLGGSVPVCL